MRRLIATLWLLAPLAGWADTGPVAVPEPSDKAWSYYYTRNALWAVGLAWGLLVPALFLFTGWSARLRDIARGRGRGWALTVLLYFVMYSVLAAVLTLPLAFYGGYVVEHQFGLSNQTLAKWVTDILIGAAIELVVGYVLVLGVYGLLRRSPRRWWLYSGLALIPFIVLMLLVSPIWIDPLFNKFGPMKDRALEAKIVALADRAGIEGARVFEVDKSVDTKKVNAYVTGFADTQRIVLWDTIIQRLDERELLFVMGHEMGHYALGHVREVIGWLSLIVMACLYGAHRLAGDLIARHRTRLGFERLDDIASYPLIGFVASLVLMVATPAYLVLSRHNERESDRFGLEITRDNRACGTAFVRLTVDDLAIARPDPVLHALRSPHPSVAERIDFCNSYRPWESGQPLRYGKHFRP